MRLSGELPRPSLRKILVPLLQGLIPSVLLCIRPCQTIDLFPSNSGRSSWRQVTMSLCYHHGDEIKHYRDGALLVHPRSKHMTNRQDDN